ncbi:hypothetical protein OG21DRAFT_312895 [Imleria badia]|nr:hypothetical protein OG21DRAFT_312895 [Imleria badia]
MRGWMPFVRPRANLPFLPISVVLSKNLGDVAALHTANRHFRDHGPARGKSGHSLGHSSDTALLASLSSRARGALRHGSHYRFSHDHFVQWWIPLPPKDVSYQIVAGHATYKTCDSLLFGL